MNEWTKERRNSMKWMNKEFVWMKMIKKKVYSGNDDWVMMLWMHINNRCFLKNAGNFCIKQTEGLPVSFISTYTCAESLLMSAKELDVSDKLKKRERKNEEAPVKQICSMNWRRDEAAK